MSGYITIKLRRGTAAQWTSSNPILSDGEVGLETDTRKFKVGNGSGQWTSLQYWGGAGGGASAFVDLTDVPASYSGQGGKLVRVKADASGLEFYTLTIAAADLPTGIDAAKIADGTVSNTEFQRLNGVTSDIQTQLDNKQPLALVLTNTTASFTTADETKLDNITITQAVNLDTLETDSHTHSNKAVLDATTASFLTADETKLDGIEALADVTDAGNVGSSIHGASGKTTPVDADTMPLIDSAASNVLKKVTWANIKATLKTYFDTLYQAILTASNLHTFVDALTALTTPADADRMIIVDNSASLAKKITWANLKATLKTYFDTLYQAAGTYLTSANITQVITNGVTDKAPSEDAVFDALAAKQDTLVSGTNIKTVNSTSLVGSGDVAVQATLVSGTNIKTINGSSILGSGDLVVSGGGGNTQIYLDQSPDNGTYALLSGSINGSNTLFTVSQGVYISGTLVVARNGQVLTQGGSNDWVETTPASGTFTFNTAPNTGDILTAWYNKTVVVGANFTSGTAAPSGGVDGDIYLQYT